MTPVIVCGDARQLPLKDQSVHMVCTSPPYWGLRDYGVEGQLGLEPAPDLYVAHLVTVFREVWRVLRDDGTLWLNMGDSYATGAGSVGQRPGGGVQGDRWNGNRGTHTSENSGKPGPSLEAMGPRTQPNRMPIVGLKPKDLVGIPWRVAFALQADGWYLRSDIIWSKPNPMPESVTDRPTKAHEYLFLLSKSASYYYDGAAIREPVTGNAHVRGNGVNPKSKAWKTPDGWDTSSGNGGHGDFHRNGREKGRPRQNESFSAAVHGLVDDRNRRSVWTIATQPYPEAHFATFPEDLVKPCVLAGCPAGGYVLDPFVGSGTVVKVAQDLGRRGVGVELKPEYLELARKRTAQLGLIPTSGTRRLTPDPTP